jgi:hypothetical protein
MRQNRARERGTGDTKKSTARRHGYSLPHCFVAVIGFYASAASKMRRMKASFGVE